MKSSSKDDFGHVALLDQASANDGVVCRDAERRKHARYPAQQAPWRMVPVAFETFGRLGSEGYFYRRKLARRASEQAGNDGGFAPSLLFTQWARRLSVCLHRANARAILRRAPAIPPPHSAMAAAQSALARAQAENSAGNMLID